MSNAQHHNLSTMANHSSDPSNTTTSNDNDSDHPRTPPLAAAPHRRANTGQSSMAPSKIPKLSTASVSYVQAPVSPPRTPADRDAAPTALDWGSGGEWSALVGEIRMNVGEVQGEVIEDDVTQVEVSDDAQDLPSESAIASSGLFDDFEHVTTDLKQPSDSIQPKEVSDDEDPFIVFEDIDQQKGEDEEEEVHGGVVLEGKSSDASASQTSDSEHSDIHYPFALKERSTATESFNGFSDDEELPVVSAMKESEEHIVEQNGPHRSAEQETDLPEAGASQTAVADPDTFPTPHLKQYSNANRLEKVDDYEQQPVVSLSGDVEKHISEKQELHETAMQATEPEDADASQTSGSDSDMRIISEPKQSGKTGHLEIISDDEQQPVVSASEDVAQSISKQKDLREHAMQGTNPSDADVSHTSDSDVSDMELPAATIRGPFLNLMGMRPTAESRGRVSPRMVLRGLIRDAHPGMIHFTLPHSSFSPDDLREGLQYAYSMLQAATSKLATLELLDDETTGMTGADLRRWIALADNSNSRAHTKPRISVMFEILSIVEMKTALQELVQSRLVVEGEAEKTQMSLMRKVVAKEREEKSVVIPVKRAADFDKEGRSKKRRVSEEDDETALDAFLTAIMVLLIGVLYLYVRE